MAVWQRTEQAVEIPLQFLPCIKLIIVECTNIVCYKRLIVFNRWCWNSPCWSTSWTLGWVGCTVGCTAGSSCANWLVSSHLCRIIPIPIPIPIFFGSLSCLNICLSSWCLTSWCLSDLCLVSVSVVVVVDFIHPLDCLANLSQAPWPNPKHL